MFRRFIAVDWSGAKTRARGLAALQVAACRPGTEPPALVSNPHGGAWRRADLGRWLAAEAAAAGRVLAGLDFVFALPYCCRKAYFPGLRGAPLTPSALWRRVDTECASDPDLYAGTIHRRGAGPLAAYFNRAGAQGRCFKVRWRETEKRARSAGTRPVCAFNCVGPSVGAGSLAGMRFLHRLRRAAGGVVRVWPFEPVEDARLVLVEIFPQFFIKRALDQTKKVRDIDPGNRAVERFGSRPLDREPHAGSADAWDALITAAALRHLTSKPGAFATGHMSACARRYEGWIFGVT